ncbi:MAG: PTS sugar transporter subunit IIB [Faecalibacillus sp.]
MDDFLKEINVTLFREWIMYQDFDFCQMKREANNIVLETKCGIGYINFYDDCIIELNVENKNTQETVFFIHFQMNNLHHAIGLLMEMKECLDTLVEHQKIKILLSCSSGFTTGFFAEKLQDAALLLNKDYEFHAVAYSELFDVGRDYDMILLAPQVSYMLSKVEEVLKDKIVLTLSSTLFGKYDVSHTFDFIENELAKVKEKDDDEENPLTIKQKLSLCVRILCLAFLITDNKVRLVSRLYDQGDMILEDYEMFKNKISLNDITDMIDYILLKYSDIEIISISLPGVIYNGVITLKRYGFIRCEIQSHLEKKYKQKIVINNDVNTLVMGYYASQDEYKSISLLFQARIGGGGGVGHIHNGHLMKGRHNIAGEIQYLPISFSDNFEKNKKTPEGALEWTSKYCLAITSMIAPEAIIVYNRLVTSAEKVREEMKKYMPEEYIPDIIKIEGLKEYVLLGCIILGLKEAKN